jgi:DNA adenine methylase
MTFDDTNITFVNVALCRSAALHPGGKTWIVPRLRRWLSPQIRQQFGLTPVRPTRLIEPFAGGSIVSLTTAAEGLTEYVTMVEIDEDVAAVWKTILDGENWQWFAREIETFDLTHENVTAFFARTNLTLREQAFRTILRNRVNRGGIMAQARASLKGENGRALDRVGIPLRSRSGYRTS